MSKVEKGFSLIRVIKEDVIGTENSLFGWSLLTAVVIIFAMGFYLSMPNLSFHGMASAREIVINFEYPVEVSDVHVVPGQSVKKGELLLELSQTNLNTRIRELTARVEQFKAQIAIRDQMNVAVGNGGGNLQGDPLSVELRDSQSELAVLQRQRNALYIFADRDGVIGSVNYMKGHRVPAFSAVLTMGPQSPTSIEGYIPERLRSSLHVGSLVNVHSLTGDQANVIGHVVGIAGRYVVIPARLVPEARGVELWGREVTIEIPSGNQLLLAETVLISPRFSFLPELVEQAVSEPAPATIGSGPQPITVPFELAGKTRMEVSGAVYLADLKKYLVVSDDTDTAHSPWLFLMSGEGHIDAQPLIIPGIPTLKDLESVSSEGNTIYVMSSLLENSKGNVKIKSNALVKIIREGVTLKSAQTVNLGKLLREKISRSTDPVIKEVQKKIEKLEVEAHAVKDGRLYIALKRPRLKSGATVILQLSSVDQLFTEDADHVQLSLWKSIEIPDLFSQDQRISDMVFQASALLFASTCKGADCGAIWNLEENSSTPSLVQSFANEPPEGIAIDSVKQVLMVTFDLGSRGSKFAVISLPHLHR